MKHRGKAHIRLLKTHRKTTEPLEMTKEILHQMTPVARAVRAGACSPRARLVPGRRYHAARLTARRARRIQIAGGRHRAPGRCRAIGRPGHDLTSPKPSRWAQGEHAGSARSQSVCPARTPLAVLGNMRCSTAFLPLKKAAGARQAPSRYRAQVDDKRGNRKAEHQRVHVRESFRQHLPGSPGRFQNQRRSPATIAVLCGSAPEASAMSAVAPSADCHSTPM